MVVKTKKKHTCRHKYVKRKGSQIKSIRIKELKEKEKGKGSKDKEKNTENYDDDDDLDDLPNYSDSYDSDYINPEVENLLNQIQKEVEEEQEKEEREKEENEKKKEMEKEMEKREIYYFNKQRKNDIIIKSTNKQKEKHINFVTAAIAFNIPIGTL